MGYYTNYDLSHDGSVDAEKLSEAFEEVTSYTLDYVRNGAKWYDHEKDMRVLSRMFPGTLFTLEGDGEEQGDNWMMYIKDGKMQTCRAIITFEPFDERKMT